MISRVSGVIAKWLLQAGAISAEDLDLYIYGIYSFLFTITPLSLVVLLSLPLNMPLEGILLVVSILSQLYPVLLCQLFSCYFSLLELSLHYFAKNRLLSQFWYTCL